ncbi:MAG: DNA-processing protein DprA [Adhaeribacter sp.]
MPQDLLYEVALGLLPGIGSTLTRQLVSYCGSPRQVFSTPPGRLLKIPGIGKSHVSNLPFKTVLKQAETIVRQAEQNQVSLLFYTHPQYPARLKHIADAPTLLYFKGTANLNTAKIVAIVGTRQCTAYGREVTEQIIQDLVQHQALVVSGLAYGIDVAAHRAALQAGLPTIGVMAHGLDMVYPSQHQKISRMMLEEGGLLSEYGFGTKPEPPRFPARNRIIAGLADATLIVEAAIKGGALITADIAHSYNKDVMAVPGPITAPFSAGCNHLIKTNKAAAYTDIRDLVELLNWDLEQPKTSNRPGGNFYPPEDFTAEEYQVLQVLLETKEEQIDNLSWKSQLPIGQVASLLLALEFKGVVKSLPGKKFQVV